MLDDRPILKDRLFATAVFSGIAIAAVAGVELVIGGGLDPITPSFERASAAPTSYVTIVDGGWTPSARTTPVSFNEPIFIVDEWDVSADENLAGGYDYAQVAPALAPSDEELYQEIDALYADAEGYGADGEASAYDIEGDSYGSPPKPAADTLARPETYAPDADW